MRVTIQRVKEASVLIDNQIKSEIKKGLVVFLGISPDDTKEDVKWLCKKTCCLRIFPDVNDKMNKSLIDSGGEVLLISQFTLFASTKKGNRPSHIRSAPPSIAFPLYESFHSCLEQLLGKEVAAGKFGADMKVYLCNDGPVTINIDSKIRE